MSEMDRQWFCSCPPLMVLLCSSFTPLVNGASTSRDGSYSSSVAFS